MRVTLVPPVGAAALRVTVPVEVDPPPTLVGLMAIPDKLGGLTVRLPPTDPEGKAPLILVMA